MSFANLSLSDSWFIQMTRLNEHTVFLNNLTSSNIFTVRSNSASLGVTGNSQFNSIISLSINPTQNPSDNSASNVASANMVNTALNVFAVKFGSDFSNLSTKVASDSSNSVNTVIALSNSVNATIANSITVVYNQANAAYVQANAAYVQANTGNPIPAFNQANAAYGQANSATTTAGAAYGLANTLSLNIVGVSANIANGFVDNTFTINGSSDATKKLRFEVDGFTTGQIRVATAPDSNFTMAALDVSNQVVTGGARVTSNGLGTISSGTTTLDPGTRPMWDYTNNGAHTLAPGTNNGSIVLDITNGASAGAITVSGWTKVIGAFDTTNAHKFRCFCSIGAGGSLLSIQPLF